MLKFKVKGSRGLGSGINSALSGLHGEIVDRALGDLGDDISKTINDLFGPVSGPSIRGESYKHGYTGEYLGSVRTSVSNGTLTVTDASKRVDGILHGTSPVATSGGAPNPSYGVVVWALQKLQVTDRTAFAMSRSVAIHGLARPDGSSPIVGEYPSQFRFFKFPEWILKVKNKGSVDAAAKRIGDLVVRYIEGGRA